MLYKETCTEALVSTHAQSASPYVCEAQATSVPTCIGFGPWLKTTSCVMRPLPCNRNKGPHQDTPG